MKCLPVIGSIFLSLLPSQIVHNLQLDLLLHHFFDDAITAAACLDHLIFHIFGTLLFPFMPLERRYKFFRVDGPITNLGPEFGYQTVECDSSNKVGSGLVARLAYHIKSANDHVKLHF